MQSNEMIDQITWKMVDHDRGSAKRIQHFLTVHRFAQLYTKRTAETFVQGDGCAVACRPDVGGPVPFPV